MRELAVFLLLAVAVFCGVPSALLGMFLMSGWGESWTDYAFVIAGLVVAFIALIGAISLRF